MNTKYLIKISFICCLGLMPLVSNAQSRIWSEDLLGAGGSNYSSRSDRRIQRQNGLRTGQYSGEHHLIGAYLDGAYSAFYTNTPQAVSLPGGYATGGGFLYQYQHNSFAINIGLGIRWQDVYMSVEDSTFTWYNTADSWTNQRDTFRYDLTYSFSNRRDNSKNLYIQIPILFGQTMGGGPVAGLYYLAGIKLNMAIKGNTSTVTTGNTIGVYDRYMGIFHEMDNHGLRKDVLMKRNYNRLELKMDILASFELGYEWASPAPRGYRTQTIADWRLRLGAFIDWGLLNINPQTDNTLILIPKDYMYDFSEYEFYHILSTKETQGRSVHNLFCGIKLTALIGIKFKEKCIICGPFQTERDM